MGTNNLLEAYTERLVVDLSKEKLLISSIYGYGDRLLVGLSSGSLQVYTIDDPHSNSLKARLLKTYEHFSKKSIDGLGAIRDAESLVVLSDGVVSLYDLTSYSLNETLSKTKGASTFAIYEGAQIDYGTSVPSASADSASRYYVREELEDQGNQVSSLTDPAPPSAFVSRLAIACRRKLIYYVWKDTEFVDYKEVLLSEKIASLSFTKDGNKVICGLSSDFVVVDLKSASVIKTLSAVAGQAAETSSFTSMSSYIGIGGHQANTLSSQLYQDTSIVMLSTKCKLLDAQWNPLQVPLALEEKDSGSPTLIDYSYPYFICVFKDHVEVRNAVTMCLYQTISLPDVSFINTGKAFYLATNHQIFKLLPSGYRSQVDQLAAKEEWTEAVSLLTQIESVLIDRKQELLRELQTQRAVEMFKNSKYDEAMDLFSEISASPDVVINLFPPPISDNANTQDDKDQTASRSTASNAESNIDSSNVPEEMKRSVRALRSFLAETRRKISTLAVSNIKVKYQGYELSEEIYGNLDAAADLVDTCLFKCYMLTSPALVGPLVRVHNHCDPHIVTKALTDSEKWSELIDFYYGKSMHEEALTILRNKSENNDDANLLAGPGPTVRYLQKLDNEHLDLVLKFGKWPLTVNQDKYGEDLFLEDSPESLSYDRTLVFKYLMNEPQFLSITVKYLEYIIDYLNDTTPSFHNSRILLYLKDIERYGDRLIEFIARAPFYYRPNRIVQDFPANPTDPKLIEALAVVHGHRGDHKSALKLLAFGLRDAHRSRTYCSNLYDEDPDMGSSALHTLLSLYLEDNTSESKSNIIELLASQGSRMSILETLSTLPAALKIGEIKDFLHSHLRMMTNDIYSEQLHSSLYKVQLVRTEETHLELGVKHTVVTNLRTCKICKRRLGYSVIAIFPDNAVVHYGCSNAYAEILEKQNKKQYGYRNGDSYNSAAASTKESIS